MAERKGSLAAAEARYVRVSPQKARLVVDMIRGQQAGEAVNILGATNKRITRRRLRRFCDRRSPMPRTVRHDVDVDKLFVSEAYVNEGPRMKRVRPAPMGRAYRYQRRMAHIIVKVGDEEAETEKE